MPTDVATHADGRAPIGELYRAYAQLADAGWTLELIAQSQPAGTSRPLPIIALRSPLEGPAVWILAGVHGEEPAGPNAVAAAIDAIAALGARRPVMLLPLLNPHGYARNWRYLNVAQYSETIDGASVGDSSHLLPDPQAPGRPRAAAPPAEQDPEQRLRVLEAELAGLKEQLLRKRADFDNFRRRVERDRQSAFAEATAELLQELIPTLDNLERALQASGSEGSLREGVALIQRELLALLEARGVSPEDPTGQPFDPRRHQALSHEVVAGAEPGTVVETFRKGYLFKDRLLRPALVKVAKEDAPEVGDEPELMH